MVNSLQFLRNVGDWLAKFEVVDVHVHMIEKLDELFKWYKRFNINKLCLIPRFPFQGTNQMIGMNAYIEANSEMAKLMKEYPDQILGYCFLNPCFEEAAAEEFETCVKDFGMIGVKLYTHCNCLDPRFEYIAKSAMKLKAPILIHTEHRPRRYLRPTPIPNFSRPPTLSTPDELATLARKYPELTIIEAHIGVGDWEWGIKEIKDVPNIFLDMSGSGSELGIIETAIRELGAERIVFGTDNRILSGVGKIFAADITEEEKRLILGENLLKILRR